MPRAAPPEKTSGSRTFAIHICITEDIEFFSEQVGMSFQWRTRDALLLPSGLYCIFADLVEIADPDQPGFEDKITEEAIVAFWQDELIKRYVLPSDSQYKKRVISESELLFHCFEDNWGVPEGLTIEIFETKSPTNQ